MNTPTPDDVRRARDTAQTRTEHMGEFCTLSSSIRVDDGEIEVRQRIHDSPEGYAKGKARVDRIAQALADQRGREVAFGEHMAPPHARYLVQRQRFQFVATPCYGMHAPWWVPMTPTGESDPIATEPDDTWISLLDLRLPPRDSGREEALAKFILDGIEEWKKGDIDTGGLIAGIERAALTGRPR